MEKLPLEILGGIAAYLSASDLVNFRLAQRRFAEVGNWVIARNGLSTLNTSSCLRELQQLLQSCSSIAQGTKQLTLYHGSWPVCSQGEWETHPLLFGGNDRWNTVQFTNRERVEEAFSEYKMFITEEQDRRVPKDVETMAYLLNLLPNLRTIVVSHMQDWAWHPTRNAKFHNLQKRIWMNPCMDDNVAEAVQVLSLAFSNKLCAISCLKIYGTLDPSELYLSPPSSRFPTISKLCVMSFKILENGDVIQKFLQSFPNLVELSVKFQGWESSIPNIIEGLSWPHLQVLRLDDLWASEDEIFDLFKRHQRTLQRFSLGDTTIVKGSWRSLFTRIRNVCVKTQIVVDGELYGRRSRDTVTIRHHGAAARLTSFMQNKNVQWPFGLF